MYICMIEIFYMIHEGYSVSTMFNIKQYILDNINNDDSLYDRIMLSLQCRVYMSNCDLITHYKRNVFVDLLIYKTKNIFKNMIELVR